MTYSPTIAIDAGETDYRTKTVCPDTQTPHSCRRRHGRHLAAVLAADAVHVQNADVAAASHRCCRNTRHIAACCCICADCILCSY